ncbi:MAG: hypothetical protein BVN34_00940 [Proteobacteria bacterium ST_bin12]|nr:MAG: hypothetical protein BVN34_00940 [Proteobacteria bacterium ST_bin12]
MIWSERETIVFQFEELSHSDIDEIDLIEISKVRVVIPGYKYPVDIGSWCYTSRKKPNRATNSEKCTLIMVNLASFRKDREDFVRRYLRYLYSHLSIGKSPKSLQTAVWMFSRFVAWCDAEFPQALDHFKFINEAIYGYSEMLIKKSRSSKISVNTAAVLQVIAMNALNNMYDEKYGVLFEGVRRISKSHLATKVTEPPTEADAAKALLIYRNLFEQLTDFVLNFSKFPMQLKLENKSFWFFPNEIPFASCAVSKRGYLTRKTFVAYNLEEGRLNSELEIYQKLDATKNDRRRRSAKEIYSRALRKVEAANQDRFHHRRILAATLAQQSFIMLFAANSAMGAGQMSALPWEGDEYEVLNERQGFKTIKYRANGKLVTFLIATIFYGQFRIYLRLRKYLLDAYPNEVCNHLFFMISSEKIKEISMDMSHYFNSRIKRLFDYDIQIGTRQLRAFKSDWLLRNTDLITTAMVLQNTPETVLKHYTAGSESVAVEELTSYFDGFKKKLVISTSDASTPIGVGQCTSINSPAAIAENGSFEPDCIKPEGCFFCENYAVHSDSTDFKKIISYRYLLEQTKQLADSEQHFHRLFNPVLSKINNVIEAIKSSGNITEDQCSSIVRQVYEFEQLDIFWQRKLDFLIELDIL